MLKATLKQIAESTGSINLLMQGKKVPPKAAYAVSKLAKACANEMEHYGEQRKKVFDEAGCTVDTEKSVYVHADGQEKVDAVAKEAEQLLDAEVEINALALDLEQFGDKAELDAAAFFGLEWAMKQ